MQDGMGRDPLVLDAVPDSDGRNTTPAMKTCFGFFLLQVLTSLGGLNLPRSTACIEICVKSGLLCVFFVNISSLGWFVYLGLAIEVARSSSPAELTIIMSCRKILWRFHVFPLQGPLSYADTISARARWHLFAATQQRLSAYLLLQTSAQGSWRT